MMEFRPPIPSRTISRRRALAVGGAGAAAVVTGLALGAKPASASPAVVPPGDLLVVHSGVARAVVVTDDGASSDVRDAAAELIAFVAKSSGVTLPTATLPSSPPPDGLTAIYLGFAGPDSHPVVPRLLERRDGDGFLIAPYKGTITIIGATEWGTINGVYGFLRTLCGCRMAHANDNRRRRAAAINHLSVAADRELRTRLHSTHVQPAGGQARNRRPLPGSIRIGAT